MGAMGKFLFARVLRLESHGQAKTLAPGTRDELNGVNSSGLHNDDTT